MAIASLEARVAQVLTDRLGMSPADIQPKARLVQDLGLDSLDAVELAMATEREFGVSIADEEVARLVTVGDLVALVHQLTEARDRPATGG